MRRGLMFVAAALFVTGATAPDSGHCDSKPFSLRKPVAAPAKPVAAPVAMPAPKPAPKPAPVKTAKTNKFVPGCKQPKG